MASRNEKLLAGNTVSIIAWDIAGMIRQSLIADCEYKKGHPYCNQLVLSRHVKKIQNHSKDGWGRPLLRLTPDGARAIARAIAREDAQVLNPHHLQPEYFPPLLKKLLIMEGDYLKDKDKTQQKCLDALVREVSTDSHGWPGASGFWKNGWNSDLQKCQQLVNQVLGSGSQAQYEQVLGRNFWDEDKFQKKTCNRGSFDKYSQNVPVAPVPIQNVPEESPASTPVEKKEQKKEASSPRTPMKNATTVMGMLGLGAVAAYGLATNDAPEPPSNPNEPPKEKFFWAQPRKYLAIAALLGASIWGLMLYNQSKPALSK